MRADAGQAVGQAASMIGRWIHRIAGLAIGVAIFALLGASGLAWRLAQGPLELPWVITQLESYANANGGPNRLSIGRAVLIWEGFARGADHPLDIRMNDIAVSDGKGGRLVEADNVRATLSIGGLLQGRALVRDMLIDGLRLKVLRGSDGAVSLDLGSLDDGITATAGSQDTAGPSLLDLLEEFSHPPETDRGNRPGGLSQLRRIRLRNAAMTFVDQVSGRSWPLGAPELQLNRGRRGGLDAAGMLELHVGQQVARVVARGNIPVGSGQLHLELSVPPIVPASMASDAPSLAAIDAPVSLSASADIGRGMSEPRFTIAAQIGNGFLRIAKGRTPIRAATVRGSGTPTRFTFRLDQLVVPGPSGATSTIRGEVNGERGAHDTTLTTSFSLDQLAFADLPAIWPEGLGGAGLRPWLTENVTAGTVRAGHLEATLALQNDASRVDITSLAGGLDGRDLTVHWLRPVPPLERGEATLILRNSTTLEIKVGSARQSNGTPQGGMAVRNGSVVITGLDVQDQFADISGDINGSVPDLFTVLRHPRIRLLDRRPIEMRDPAGQIGGKLTITRLPLDNGVTMDDLRLRAAAKLSGLHLGGVAAGFDMDRGALNLEIDNDGMKVRGTADLAGIPSQLQVELDFRDGPPSQQIQKVTVAATTDAAKLAVLGIDAAGFIDGPVALRADLSSRRSGRGEIIVRADLAHARAQFARLNWRKEAGSPASLDIRIQMDRDRVTGIDRAALLGDGLDVLLQADFANGRPTKVRLQRAFVGRDTEVSGEVGWPKTSGDPWQVQLVGRSFDMTSLIGKTDRSSSEKPPGPAWTVNANLRRIILGESRSLTNVFAHVENDGRRLRVAEVSGATAADPRTPQDVPGKFEVSITPVATGRQVTATASDAGAVLRSLDVIKTMVGGKLTLNAIYEDRKPGSPLTGTAQISDFRIKDAPSLGKLLQAMSIYGLVEALRGPGLNFSDLVAPFRLTGDTLELFDARAFSASLGATLKGRLDLTGHVVDMRGTIIPAYFFNSLLGRIPLLGRVISPERGGGLFAATFAVRGKLDNPDVSVNPLAAVTPGFLRGLFGIFDGPVLIAPPGQPTP